MTTSITSLHITTLRVLDQDEALDFYVNTLGFTVADDIDLGFMRWLTIALPTEPDRRVLLELPGPPAHDEATAAQVRELVTKGALGGLFLTSTDIHSTFATLRDAGVEITQDPVEQPYGTDIGIRDPFGNHVRISQPADAAGEFTDEVKQRYAGEAGSAP